MYLRRLLCSFGAWPTSHIAFPITVMTGDLPNFSVFAEPVWKGNRVGVQLKTVVRISHHCGFAGTSQTTTPGLSPVTSCSAISKSPSSSTFSSTTRPISANHLFSTPVRSDCIVIGVSGPGQLNISYAVLSLIALASVGGSDGSVLADFRPSP